MRKNRILRRVFALCLSVALCTPALAAGQTFTDVPSDKWYYTWVTKAAQQGWVSGTGNGKFEPGQPVTYAQFSVMLGKALYADDLAAQPSGANWWTAACEVAAKHGLFPITDMAIRDNWNDVANTPIEREQMAQMMYNALVDKGIKLPSYEEYSAAANKIADIADVDNYVAVATCYAVGLLNGDDSGNFAPRDPMTRAQACVVLCNIYGYVTGDVTGGTTPGQPTQPVDPVDPVNPVDPVDPVDPVQPDVPRPAGAVGGRYDVNFYDVPADTNKDGWITEAEVQAVLAQLREEYPNRSEWDESTWYSGRSDGRGLGAASACAGFANMVSDRIFGTLPAYHVALEETRVGDIMDAGPINHRNIVLNDYGKAIYKGTIYPEQYYTTDGNVSGKVVWDKVLRYSEWPVGTSNTYIRSRYPK